MVDRRLIAACWVVRLALTASFLSAVADRLGLWGPPGATGVSWGSVPKYEEYVAQLNWFLPARLAPVPLAAVVTSPLERCVETADAVLAGRSLASSLEPREIGRASCRERVCWIV